MDLRMSVLSMKSIRKGLRSRMLLLQFHYHCIVFFFQRLTLDLDLFRISRRSMAIIRLLLLDLNGDLLSMRSTMVDWSLTLPEMMPRDSSLSKFDIEPRRLFALLMYFLHFYLFTKIIGRRCQIGGYATGCSIRKQYQSRICNRYIVVRLNTINSLPTIPHFSWNCNVIDSSTSILQLSTLC